MRRFLIGLFLFGILSSFIFAQIKNDYEAKAFFAKNGISPLQVIQNSEFIIIKNGQIKSSGGNPILASIQPTNIVYLPGASGYVTRIRTVFIEGEISHGYRELSRAKIGRIQNDLENLGDHFIKKEP
jgi:hypothetical protein